MEDSGDELESPLIQAWFQVDKVQCHVALTKDALNWTTDAGTAAAKIRSRSLPYEEILSVRSVQDTVANDVVGFNVCYIKRDRKKLRRGHVQFLGSSKASEEWMIQLHRQLVQVPERPRKMLVLINPASGKSLISLHVGSPAVNAFENLARPIFEEAGVDLKVLVTERTRHAERIMSDYDFETIDSIVIIGGDGFYHEVVNGVLRRIQSEAGLDFNNPDAKLEKFRLPIGIIPAGTSNGIAEGCFAMSDVETAVLGIILGKTRPMNVFGVYEERRLLSYASLMVGYGFWADVANYTETKVKRLMGIARYAVALLDFGFFRSQRVMNLKVEYLKSSSTASNGSSHRNGNGNGHGNGRSRRHARSSSSSSTSSQPRPGWESREGNYVAVVCFTLDILNYFDSKRRRDLSSTTVVFNKPCSRWKTLKFLFGLVKRDVDVLKLENVEHVPIQGVKVTLNNPSPPESENGKKECMVNLDGELFLLNEFSFEIRLHSEVVQLYTTIKE